MNIETGFYLHIASTKYFTKVCPWHTIEAMNAFIWQNAFELNSIKDSTLYHIIFTIKNIFEKKKLISELNRILSGKVFRGRQMIKGPQVHIQCRTVFQLTFGRKGWNAKRFERMDIWHGRVSRDNQTELSESMANNKKYWISHFDASY